jgi:hypothetical protein
VRLRQVQRVEDLHVGAGALFEGEAPVERFAAALSRWVDRDRQVPAAEVSDLPGVEGVVSQQAGQQQHRLPVAVDLDVQPAQRGRDGLCGHVPTEFGAVLSFKEAPVGSAHG